MLNQANPDKKILQRSIWLWVAIFVLIIGLIVFIFVNLVTGLKSMEQQLPTSKVDNQSSTLTPSSNFDTQTQADSVAVNLKRSDLSVFTSQTPPLTFDYFPSYKDQMFCAKKQLVWGGKVLTTVADKKTINGCINTEGDTVISLTYWTPQQVCGTLNVSYCKNINEFIVKKAINELSKNSTDLKVTKIDQGNIHGYQVDSNYYNDGTGIGVLTKGVGPKGNYIERDIVFQNFEGTYFVLDMIRKESLRREDQTILDEIMNSLKFSS